MIKSRQNKLRENDMFYEWFCQKNVTINRPKLGRRNPPWKITKDFLLLKSFSF